jgi:hypothetical protein
MRAARCARVQHVTLARTRVAAPVSIARREHIVLVTGIHTPHAVQPQLDTTLHQVVQAHRFNVSVVHIPRREHLHVLCVLRAHILLQVQEAAQACRPGTLRRPARHVLRRRGGRVTRRSSRMQRVPRRATARASARRGTIATRRRPGLWSLKPVRWRRRDTLWRMQEANRRRPVLLARTRGARGRRLARWRPSGTMFRARRKRLRRRVARGRTRTCGVGARAQHARGQTLRRERATCAATHTRRARTRRRRTTPP